MHELELRVQPICEMQKTLTTWTQSEIAKGVHCVDIQEAGAAVDMIKDLCDAEKNLYKAFYYKTVIKAMEEYDEEEGEDVSERRGYDNWRYSSGKFAPKGHGHWAGHGGRRGFTIPMMDGWHDITPDRMTGDTEWMQRDSRYGKPYMDYMKARRHYTETKDMHDREEMDNKAVEHIGDMIATIKEIWNDATPDLKRQMKSDLQGLTSGMTM